LREEDSYNKRCNDFLIMPKLALFITAFFLLILFQQSAYGFIEGT